LAVVPSYLPFPEAQRGNKRLWQVKQRQECQKEDNHKKQDMTGNERNYTEVEHRKLKKYKFMLIISMEKQGLLDF
jgi:hypothetical protein